MKHSVGLLVILVLSSLLIVACGGGGGDSNFFDGSSNDSQIKKIILKTFNNVDHTEGHLFDTSSGKVNLPANSVAGDYNIEITKIDTYNLSDNDKSLLKSNLHLDSKSVFISPVLGISLKYNNAYSSRASVNIEGNGVQLYTVSSITINLDTYAFDWDNWYYYVAFRPNDNSGWSFTPLKKENFQGKQNQLVINTAKLSKTYVVLRMPNKLDSGVIPEIDTDTSTSTQTSTSTSTQTNTNTNTGTSTNTQTQTQTNTNTDTSTDTNVVTGMSLLAVPQELVASQTTGKFEKDMKVSVSVEYTGNNPFAYNTPTIEFLAFKPFDLGNSIKSVLEKGVYSYTYKRFISPESDFAKQASFTLTLPTKGADYDADKFPENIFITAKFKAKDNKDYQTSPTSISFKYDEIKKDEPRVATPTAVLCSLYNYANPSQLVVTESETSFRENIVINGGFAYEDTTPSFELTPLLVEFTSASFFDLGADIVSTFADDVYTYKYQVPESNIIFDYTKKCASYSLVLPLKNVEYNSGKHPAVVFIKSAYDKYESNAIAIRFVNEAAGQISVITTLPGNGNVINGSGTVTLNTRWSGIRSPYTVKYICNNQLLNQETIPDKNNARSQISGNSIGDSNGTLRFIKVRVSDSSNSNLESFSDAFIVDTQKPGLVASITNNTVFGTKDIVRIEISSDEVVYAPSVKSENVTATQENKQATGTKFIYKLQLDDSFTTGIHNVTIVASDTSEPKATANCSTIVATFSVDTSITYPFAQGAGTEDNPFLISNAEELNQVRYYPDFYYKQIADIDLKEFIESRTDYLVYPSGIDTNSACGWLPIDNFSKTYDGNNHKITNLYIKRNTSNVSMSNIGLFGALASNAIIKNLNIESKNVIGGKCIGIIVGYANNNNIIENCSVSGIASGTEQIGGIAGVANQIKNSVSSALIGGSKSIGGIAGEGQSIIDCNYNGKIVAEPLSECIGGIVGFANQGNIENCNVDTILISGQHKVGGIVGCGQSIKINNCKITAPEITLYGCYPYGIPSYSEEMVRKLSTSNIGGIMGYCSGAEVKISNCIVNIDYLRAQAGYSVENVGGILAYNDSTSLEVENCYVKTILYINITIDGYARNNYVSGIVAYSADNNMKINRCCADLDYFYSGGRGSGSVSYSSGICSNPLDATITNCYVATTGINAITTTNGFANISNCLVWFKNYSGAFCRDNFGKIENCISISNMPDDIPDTLQTCRRIVIDKDAGFTIYKLVLNNNYGWNSNILGEKTLTSENGADVDKSEFWGASTQATFWANPDKLGWDFDNVWEFRTGYNLPQLRGMPAIEDPTYIN